MYGARPLLPVRRLGVDHGRRLGGVLVHCAGGSDRTGMIASILLALNGAGAQAIADHDELGFRSAARHHGMEPGAALDEASAIRRQEVQRRIAHTDVRSYLVSAEMRLDEVERLSTLLRP